jgi:hypothetical protein
VVRTLDVEVEDAGVLGAGVAHPSSRLSRGGQLWRSAYRILTTAPRGAGNADQLLAHVLDGGAGGVEYDAVKRHCGVDGEVGLRRYGEPLLDRFRRGSESATIGYSSVPAERNNDLSPIDSLRGGGPWASLARGVNVCSRDTLSRNVHGLLSALVPAVGHPPQGHTALRRPCGA